MSHLPKLRLVMLIHNYGPMTAKEILSLDLGFSRSSLYRMLGSMEESGLLTVVSETRVRAVTEKRYDISESVKEYGRGYRGSNPEEYNTLFRGFLLNVLGEFESYAAREGSDPLSDGTGYCAVQVFGTREECDAAMARIKEVLKPMTRKTSDDQEMRSISIIIGPPSPREWPEAEGGAAE